MKKLMNLGIGFLLLGTTSVLCQNSDQLQGAWEIIYTEYAFPDTTTITTQFDNPTVKLLTKKHFAFGNLASDGESVRGGGGTYSFDGKTYTEHVKYHIYTQVIGKSIKLESKLKGDKWTIKGVVPGDNGEVHLKEIWKRIE